MRILFGLFIVALLASCSQKITQTTKTVEKDSIHIDTVKTRKVIKTKGDSVKFGFNIRDMAQFSSGQIIYPEMKKEELSFQAEDPIIFKKTQKQGRLTESVTISKKGNVVISCKEDSLKEIIEQQRITIQKFKDVTTTETRTIQVKFIPKFYKFTFWCFWLLVAIVAGGVIYRFRKVLPAPFNLIP